MVIDFQTPVREEFPEPEEEEIPDPSISVVDADDDYGKFVVEPLESGYGMTLGNPLRRVLYSSLMGTAVTWVKIEGVLHEYATIPHVKEEASEFLLNVKGIRLRSEVDRPGKLRLEVSGSGEGSATLDSPEAKLSVELNVEHGKGYVVAQKEDGQPIGVLPVDAIFTPIRKVNYTVEKTRVGQRTDFERLVIELWTDGSKTPVETMEEAANILVNQFFLFAKVQQVVEDGGEGASVALRIPAEQYAIPVERLELSSRTLNCLKRAGVDKVGEVLELSKDELLEIRNFGEKSFTELYGRLREMDLLPPELDPETADGTDGEEEQEEQEEPAPPPAATETEAEAEAEPEAEAEIKPRSEVVAEQGADG